VQGVLLEALRPLAGDDVRVTGASRTDAGVHALRQTASVSLTTERAAALTALAVQRALNARLPPDIRILHADDVDARFDARRAACGKRYVYLIDNAPVASALLQRFAWHVHAPLDVHAMRRALRGLCGRHDFSAFCAAAGRGHPPLCTVRAIHVGRRRSWVAIAISADRFLHHMVRNIVGSAVQIGQGMRTVEWLGDVLGSRDRTRAGPTAPAQGLALVRVLYPR
jgi:tRNA pseudouridine38-40 synthase